MQDTEKKIHTTFEDAGQAPTAPLTLSHDQKTTNSQTEDAQKSDETVAAKPKTEVLYVKDARNVWVKGQEPWASSFMGRLVIRSFTRGIMGAFGFALGSHLANTGLNDKKYDGKKDFSDQKNNVQRFAKLIDMFGDKLLSRVVGKERLRFGYNGLPSEAGEERRSLGHDVIDGNLGFAMASVFDAAGAKLVSVIDPHTRGAWRREDGTIDMMGLGKAVAKSSFSIAMAQMPDWAVSIPYAYQKQFQRNAISRFSPGFAQDSWQGRNGSTFKLNHEGRITGTYAKESFLDFHARFTMYNIGTMMYHDMVSTIGNSVDRLKHPEKYQAHADADRPALYNQTHNRFYNAVRYTARTVAKGLLIMTPTVPLFSTVRVLQNKRQWHNGNRYSTGFLFDKDGKTFHSVDLYHPEGVTIEKKVREDMRGLVAEDKLGAAIREYGYGENFSPYGKQATKGLFNKVANVPGKLSADFASWAANEAGEYFSQNKQAPEKGIGLFGRRAHAKFFGKSLSDAAFAYTPYIFAKAELMDRWNTNRMNLALDSVFDGISAFDKGKIKEGWDATKTAFKYNPGDVRSSHPETFPTGYDPDRGYIVVKLKDNKKDAKEELSALEQQAKSVVQSVNTLEADAIKGKEGENLTSKARQAAPDSPAALENAGQTHAAKEASAREVNGKGFSANMKPRTASDYAANEKSKTDKSWAERHDGVDSHTSVMAAR